MIFTSCPARYDGISEFLIPLEPRGSIWVGPAFKSPSFDLVWSFRAKRSISTPLKWSKMQLFDPFRYLCATAPPASPQNCQRHAKFSFSAGRFNPGRNYAERGSSLDPGPSDQNPESPNALNEGHRPSTQTGKGPKRHDSAPSAGNDAKFKRNERGVCSFLHSSKKIFHFVVKSTFVSP